MEEKKLLKILENSNVDKKGFDGAFLKSYEFDQQKAMCEKEGCKGCKDCPSTKLVGYASTFGNADRENDVIETYAFDETKKQIKNLPVLLDHSNRCGDVIGKITNYEIDSKGLKVECEIIKQSESPEVMHALSMIERGLIKTFSIGGMFKYAPKKEGEQNWKIEKIKLFELSVVAVPANDKARFEIETETGNGKATEEFNIKKVLKASQKKLKERRKINV